jgi:hypothetical protein
MADKSTISAFSSVRPTWVATCFAIPETLRRQNQLLFKEQAALAQDAQMMMAAWVKRRQDGIAAAFKAIEASYSCKDLGAVAAVFDDWWGGALARVMADMSEVSSEAIRMAGHGQKTIATLSASTAEAMRAAGK